MNRSNPSSNPDIEEDVETRNEKKKMEQELPAPSDVPTNPTLCAVGHSSRSKRKSEDSSAPSLEKKISQGSGSEPANDSHDSGPSRSEVHQKVQHDERQQEKQKDQQLDKKESFRGKGRRSRRRPAWLIALDDTNCHVFRRAVVNTITDIKAYDYSSIPSPTDDNNDDNNSEDSLDEVAADDTVEGIVIKNLVDFSELGFETDSDSNDSDTTTGSSVSTTTTVISATSFIQGMSTSDFEQLTVFETQPAKRGDIGGLSFESSSSSSSSSPTSSAATTIPMAARPLLIRRDSTFFLHDIVEEMETDNEDVELEVDVEAVDIIEAEAGDKGEDEGED